MNRTHESGRSPSFPQPGPSVRALMWRLGPDEAYARLLDTLRPDSADAAVAQVLSSSGAAGAPAHVTTARLLFDLARLSIRLPPAAASEPSRQAGAAGRQHGRPLDAWSSTFTLLVSAENLVSVWNDGGIRRSSEGGEGEVSVVGGEPLAAGWDDPERAAAVLAAGEAGASLAFAAARAADEAALRAEEGEAALASRGVGSGDARRHALEQSADEAVELVESIRRPASARDHERTFVLQADRLVQLALADAHAAVLLPGSVLWMATRGAQALSDHGALPGATPGSAAEPLTHFDIARRLDARGARRSLADAMTEPVFLAVFPAWIREMREIASRRPGTGACTVATAMQLWLWTLAHVSREGEEPAAAFGPASRGVPAWLSLAEVLAWLLAVRALVLDVVELAGRAPGDAALGRDAGGALPWLTDLCHVEAARVAGEVARVSAALVCGAVRHPSWDAEGCAGCYQADDLEALGNLVPGLDASVPRGADILAADGSHAAKAGPCVRFAGVDGFVGLRGKIDGCLAGSRLALLRVAHAIAPRV